MSSVLIQVRNCYTGPWGRHVSRIMHRPPCRRSGTWSMLAPCMRTVTNTLWRHEIIQCHATRSVHFASDDACTRNQLLAVPTFWHHAHPVIPLPMWLDGFQERSTPLPGGLAIRWAEVLGFRPQADPTTQSCETMSTDTRLVSKIRRSSWHTGC